MKPHVVFVGADKGGVGKTTVASILLDFFRERGMDVQGFDTESPKGNLKRYWPAQVEVADLETSDGQMQVFDQLLAKQVTLIDMRAGILTDTVKLLHDLGCVRLATEGRVRLSVLHVIGNSVQSLSEIGDISKALGESVRHFTVINHHTDDASFFAKMKNVSTEALNGASVVVNIPKLTTRAMEFVDGASLPFSQFGRDESQSFTMRGYVNDWKEKCFVQFDGARLGVRD